MSLKREDSRTEIGMGIHEGSGEWKRRIAGAQLAGSAGYMYVHIL
jgi:hypothetical protein